MIGFALVIFIWCPSFSNAEKAAPEVVYKPMRPAVESKAGEGVLPPPDDFKALPDPFLSYLVRKGQQEAALREQEKRRLKEAEQKRLDAQKRLETLRAAAEEKLRQMREPKTELQKLNISQLTLTAIIQSNGKSWAMVRDEKGMGYILKKGTLIGTMGGRVSKISGTKKSVEIKEPYLPKNAVKVEDNPVPVEIKLPDELFD